jgi:HAMP domain-containing protein
MTEITAALPQRRAPFVSLRIKLIVAFTLLFTVVFAAAYYWFYTSSIDRALTRVTDELDLILSSANNRIDGDDFQQLVETGVPRDDGYTDDPLYWEHVEWLHTVKQLFTDPNIPDQPRAKLYTFVAGPGEHSITFIGSSSALNTPPGGAQFKETCNDSPDECGDLSANLQAINENMLVNQSEPYTDSFGSWISGYIPIHNSAGAVVGALGVDFPRDYVDQVQSEILNAVVPAFALTYLFLFVTVWLIARTIATPISRLTRIAERIGEGDYEQDFSRVSLVSGVRDEIDTLGDVFQIMIEKVAKREEKLKQQVADLQIQIDHSKRDEQVKEIVDNDFFQSLQSKAFEMRSRRQDTTSQPTEPTEQTKQQE